MTEPKKGGARRLAQQFTRATRFVRLKDDSGTDWTSDGYAAIKYRLDPTDDLTKAQEHALNPSRLIPEKAARMFDTGEATDAHGAILFCENQTVTAAVNHEYHKRIMAAYPKAHVYISLTSPRDPVVYRVEGEPVAILMPINLKKRDPANV